MITLFTYIHKSNRQIYNDGLQNFSILGVLLIIPLSIGHWLYRIYAFANIVGLK